MTGTAPAWAGERSRRKPPRSSARTARRRRTQRRFLVRRWAVLGSIATALTLVVLVFFTPAFGVRAVEVSGTEELTGDQVRAIAAVEDGTPLVRLDTDEVAARVRQLPRVGSVEVRRSFPGTVEIAVSERTPVAVVVAGDGAHLLDAGGLDYGVLKVAPPGLPRLDAANEASTRAATAVLAALPPQLTGQIATVSAQTAGNIRLTLADGRLVRWGSAENSAHKAAVLGPLLTRPGKTYDVTAPEFPAVS